VQLKKSIEMHFFFFFPQYLIFVSNLFFTHFVEAGSEKQTRSPRQLQTHGRAALRRITVPQQVQRARSHVLRRRSLQLRMLLFLVSPKKNKQAARRPRRSPRSAVQELEVRVPRETRALSVEDGNIYADLEGHCVVLGETACCLHDYCDFVQSGCVRVSPEQFERIREQLQSTDPSSPESPSS